MHFSPKSIGIFLLFSAWIVLYPNIPLYANSEENVCFEILTESVKKIEGIDLSSVKKSERSKDTMDISSYDSFRENRVTRNKDNPYFLAKRNNIGTIISNEIYILSQFTSFWNETAFDFPLREPGINNSLGQKYPDFRDNIVYTHHLAVQWDFVSCGYLKITPAKWMTLNDLWQENYMTNILPGSGFEIYDRIERDKKNYIIGKVQVAAQNYNNEKLFTINLITVAYDNDSSYFNEYETFPLQVRAMTDPDEYKSVDSVQKRFLSLVYWNTCLELVHPTSLPSMCEWKYKSLSFERNTDRPQFSLSRFLIPEAHARLNNDEVLKDAPIASGMMLNSGTPYDTVLKLESLGDENLKAYILNALSPAYEDYIQNKAKGSWTLTEYENTFLNCGIDFSTRVKWINEWVSEIDPKNFSKNTISYPNPKIWDCIIPYPDKTHLGTIIEWSFASNQAYARKLQSSSWATGSQVTPEMSELLSERIQIETQYNTDLAYLETQLAEAGWKDVDIENRIQQLKEKKNREIASIEAWIAENNRMTSATPAISRMIQIGLWIILIILAWAMSYALMHSQTRKNPPPSPLNPQK